MLLLAILMTLLVCALALVAIGACSTRLCARLGLHPQAVLAWFGVTQSPQRRAG